MAICLQSHVYYMKPQYCPNAGVKYGRIYKHKNREDQVGKGNLQKCRADKCEDLQAHGIQKYDIKLTHISGRYDLC